VLKEATALAAEGFRVEVLGAWLDRELKARDQSLLAKLPFRFTPVLDSTEQTWAWRESRFCVKAAKLWHQYTNRETRWQLGYAVGALVRAARQRKADLFIAHSEPGLWAVHKIGKRKAVKGKQKIGVDVEDWFSEDLPAETRKHRPTQLLKSLERVALDLGAHRTCTSHAMSAALVAEYGCRPPAVIYNAFPWSDRQALDWKTLDRRDLGIPSVLWYSQTLGTDRGLGDLFDALPLVKAGFEIHLRGKPAAGFEDWLAAKVPARWRQRVFIHPLVSNAELLSRIAEHDIGFAGEQKNISRNRDLTVTNKILHYLLGGLAVLASDTAGQKETAAKASGAVRVYRSGDAASLAQELNALLGSTELLRTSKTAALATAEKEFCWELQTPVLVQSVKNALDL